MSHMLVVLFAACGISGMVAYLEDIDTTADYSAFLKELAGVSWPLAVAAGLYMLVQIACQLQQAVLTLRMHGLPASGQGRYKDEDGLYEEEGISSPAPLRQVPPQRSDSREAAGGDSRKPVSFFDISDAVIPPSPQAASALAPSATEERLGEQASQGGVTEPGNRVEPTPRPEDGKAKPGKDPHFFTLD